MKVFIDLDGVLADLPKAVCRFYGVPCGGIGENIPSVRKGDPEYPLFEGCPNLARYLRQEGAVSPHGLGGITGMASVWDDIEMGNPPGSWCAYDFWANQVEPYPWAETFWRRVRMMEGVSEVNFVSSPTDQRGCVEGKREWVDRLAGLGGRCRNFCLLPATLKSRLAGPGTLLLDDLPWVVREFEENGGIGVLFGTPWNQPDVPSRKRITGWESAERALSTIRRALRNGIST